MLTSNIPHWARNRLADRPNYTPRRLAPLAQYLVQRRTIRRAETIAKTTALAPRSIYGKAEKYPVGCDGIARRHRHFTLSSADTGRLYKPSTIRRPEWNSRRFDSIGLVANDPAAAAANTAALKSLVAPGGNCAGHLWFANSTGRIHIFLTTSFPSTTASNSICRAAPCILRRSAFAGHQLRFHFRDPQLFHRKRFDCSRLSGGGRYERRQRVDLRKPRQDSQYFSPVFDSLCRPRWAISLCGI